MKFSFMTFSTTDLTLDEVLAAAKEYGYDAIEPRLDANHKHGIEVAAAADERAALKNTVDASGIALSCLATSLRYADPASREQVINETHERIDLAGDMGCARLRVFGGKLAEGLDREAAIELVAGCLAEVAGHAAERNVTLCLETHDDWCDPKHVAAVVSRVDHPNIAVNWDILHPIRHGLATMDEAFDALKPWIRHLHIHDGDGDGINMVPIGTGIVDHVRAMELLKTIDFDGYLSGEWIRWEPYDVHLPRELATLRRLDAETDGPTAAPGKLRGRIVQ